MEKIKKYSCSAIVFIVNILLLVLGYQVIKNNDPKNVIPKEDINTTIQPLSQEILDTQIKIAADRENKLRDLNTAPKTIKQNQTITNTTTTVPKASTKTKTS